MNVDLETTPEPQSRRRLVATSAAIGFLAGALVVAVIGVMWERRHEVRARGHSDQEDSLGVAAVCMCICFRPHDCGSDILCTARI